MIDLFDESTSKHNTNDNLNDSFLNNFENSRGEDEHHDLPIGTSALEKREFNFLASGLENVDNRNLLDDPFKNIFSGSNYQEKEQEQRDFSNGADFNDCRENPQGISNFGENLQIETEHTHPEKKIQTQNCAGNIQTETQERNYAAIAESRKTSTGMSHMFLLPNQTDRVRSDSQKHFKSGSNSTHSGNTRSRDNSIPPSEMNLNPYGSSGFDRNLIVPIRNGGFQKNIFSGGGFQSPSEAAATFQNSENSRMSKRDSSGKKRRRRKKKSGKMLITEENYTENFDYKQFINQELAKLGECF